MRQTLKRGHTVADQLEELADRIEGEAGPAPGRAPGRAVAIWPKAPTRTRKVRKLAEISKDHDAALKARELLGQQLVRLAQRYGKADAKVRRLTRELDRAETLLIEQADAASELARIEAQRASREVT
jgi:hypothetical protein